MGCGQGLRVGVHEHVPMGKPENVILTRADAAGLAFGSLLWAQACAVCGERQIFFCDKHQRAETGAAFARLRGSLFPSHSAGSAAPWTRRRSARARG